MSDFGFPKQTRSQGIGRAGEAWFESFVTSVLGWVYRPVHREADFGIDGYIEVVSQGAVTGRTLAVQIKCGDTYIRKTTIGGIKYEGSNHHLNYYLNLGVPVILVVLGSKCDEGYWVEFDIARTNSTSSGWWIEVPKRNRLDEQVAPVWSDIAGPADDFSEGVQLMWAIDDAFSAVDYRAVAIPFTEVQSCSMDYIFAFIDRLTKTRERLLSSRGRLEIYFPGFESDPREIYQIPEVRRWFDLSLQCGVPWFYFLDTRGRGPSLKMLLFSTTSIEVGDVQGGRQLVSVSAEARREWLMKNFENLNRFTRHNEIPEEINRERCEAVLECLDRGFAEASGGEGA